MNSMRKALGFLMMSALAAFALTSGAVYGADKHYTIAMTSSGASPATVTATFTNSGNSSFNSLTLSLPTSGYSFAPGATVTASRGQATFVAGKIQVLNINLPTGAGQQMSVTITGVIATGSCGSGVSGNWSAVLWTGSGLTGNNFTRDGPAGSTSITPACYTVAYFGNSNTGGTPPAATTYASGATATVSGAGSLTRTGYRFAGWNTAANGSGTAYAAGATFTVTAPVNLYAQWTAVYSVSYSANGSTSGTVPTDSGKYATGETVTVANNTGSLAKTGYTFSGWNTAADGSGSSYAGGGSFAMGTADVILYAKWTINTYTVSFNSNGGSAVTSQDVQYGNYATVPSPAPTKSLNTFAGWYGDSALTTAFNFAGTAITGPTTIYAKWTANLMTITGPTSAAAGEPFPITVSLTGPTSVTLSVSAGCTMIPPAPLSVPVTGNPMTFNVTIAATIPPSDQSCSIIISAPGYPDATLAGLKVYKGVLDCGDYDSVNGPLDSTYDPDLPSSLSGLGSSYVGPAGWGLRRGPNKDGAACKKINYSCDLDATTNVASCTWDKAFVPAQQATFKYLFLWDPRAADASGWTTYRPQVSWGVAAPNATFTLPDWVPLVACKYDLFPLSGDPTLLLPDIPNVPPFDSAANTLPQYQPVPTQKAMVCGAQQGWTAVGPISSPKIQIWNIIIDEADLKVAGPQ